MYRSQKTKKLIPIKKWSSNFAKLSRPLISFETLVQKTFKVFAWKIGLQINLGIFVTWLKINSSIIKIFIDNLKVMRVKGLSYIKSVKERLVTIFEILDIGPISFYLGLKVKKDCQKKTLKLFQSTYIKKILSKYYLVFAKLCNISIKKTIFFSKQGIQSHKSWIKRITRDDQIADILDESNLRLPLL